MRVLDPRCEQSPPRAASGYREGGASEAGHWGGEAPGGFVDSLSQPAVRAHGHPHFTEGEARPMDTSQACPHRATRVGAQAAGSSRLQSPPCPARGSSCAPWGLRGPWGDGPALLGSRPADA